MTDTKTATPTPGPVAKTEAENPKVVAPAKPDPTPGTKEEEEAKVRALDLPGEEASAASNIGTPVGEPVQCIVKRKFISERGETVKPGMTFYYQERKGQVWPDYLEPVSKAKAAAVKKDLDDRRAEKEEVRAKKAQAREFFASAR